MGERGQILGHDGALKTLKWGVWPVNAPVGARAHDRAHTRARATCVSYRHKSGGNFAISPHLVPVSPLCSGNLSTCQPCSCVVWSPPRTDTTVDAAFRINEGRRHHGTLTWADHTGQGTKKGRESPISLRGDYVTHWSDYSEVSAPRNGQFRYLSVAVN